MEQPQNTDTRPTNKTSSQTNHQNVRTNRGLLQHLNFRRNQKSDLQQTVIKVEVRNNLNYDYDEGHNDGN